MNQPKWKTFFEKSELIPWGRRLRILKDLYEALKLKLVSKENDHKMRSLLLMTRAINLFHVTSRLSKIQNKGATKVIFLIRRKKRYIYSVCNLQLNSVLRLEIRAF